MGYYEELQKGKYKLFADFRDEYGKRYRKSKTVKVSGPREARKRLELLEEELREEVRLKIEEKSGKVDLGKMTFGEFVFQWKKNYAALELGDATQEIYDYILDYLIPIFEKDPMREITTIQLVKFFTSEVEQGNRSLEKKYNVLLSIFSHAKKWGVIELNPMDGVSKPKVKPKKKNPYTKEELRELAKYLPSLSKYHQRIIMTTVECGLRRGEVVGLCADVLDIPNNRILIKRSLQYTKKKGLVLKTTKTEDETFLHVTSELMDELNQQRIIARKNKIKAGDAWQGFKDDKGEEVLMLFADELGIPYHPNAVTRFWNRFMKRTKLRYISFHDLRHSTASILNREGIPTKSIQSRLRHKNYKTTMNIYVHDNDSDDQQTAQVFKDIWK